MKPPLGDLLAMIDHFGKEPPKRPSGAGWFTIAQMAKQRKIGVSAMRYRFNLAITRGLKVERFIGSDFDATETLVKQTWFRVKT